MKLAQAPQDVAVQGDFKTSDFNVGDVAFIVDLFADKIYTNKVRAVLRELSCNAHDAHVVAGTTDIPFDIHLPTKLEPYFTIRDYGTGLSDAEVRSIFCGIGISTKRDSDDVIGCFGIGSLSPYALGDSFTVRSYHNGVMRTYNCYRDDQRNPVVALLTEVETDEKNGLEISVNVEPKIGHSGCTDWSEEAVFVYRHWKGTSFAINDGTVLEKLQNRNYQVKGDFYGMTGDYGKLCAVMGNIAYDMSEVVEDYQWRHMSGYIEFDMGELDFDTARENLSITEKTTDAVKAKLSQVKSSIVKDITAHIESLPTQWDRAVYCERLSSKFKNLFGNSDLEKYRLPTCSTDLIYYNTSGKGSGHRLNLWSGTRYFLDKRGYVARLRAAAKNSRDTLYILNQEQADEMMVPAEVLEDLETLPKVYRCNGGTARSVSTVKVFTLRDESRRYSESREWWEESEVDSEADEIVYMEINRWCPDKVETFPKNALSSLTTNYSLYKLQQELRLLGIEKPTIVGLKSAFCRSAAFTQSDKYIRYEDWLVREINKVCKTKGFIHQEFDSKEHNRLTTISKYVKSDELESVLSLQSDQGDFTRYLLNAVDIYNIKLDVETSTKLQESMDKFLDKYGMLSYIGDWEISEGQTIKDIANYINGTIRKGFGNNG